MGKRYKAKVKAEVEMIVYIHEDVNGNQEVEDIDDVTEIVDFEIREIIY
ncbi:hypothetical protein P4482_09170 [Neobacillus thermocopriae]|nr:hypothetical protein [Neobacillus thermocopriae]MED3714389.1 hypothetical protein [Neobacillus thermocopriae]